MAEHRRVLPFLLVLLPVLWLVGEVALVVAVAKVIGWWTLLALVGTSLVGTFILLRAGRNSMQRLRAALATGELRPMAWESTSLHIAGASLLIMPGFLSDALGLLCLLPGIGPAMLNVARRWLPTMPTAGDPRVDVIPGSVVEEPSPETTDGPLVIEGTVIDDDRDQ